MNEQQTNNLEQTEVPTQNSVEKPKKKNTKFLLIGLIVVIVGVLATTVYFIKTKESKPKDTKKLDTICFETNIPTNAVVNENFCSPEIMIEGSNVPYIEIYSIIDDGDAKYGLDLLKQSYENELKNDANFVKDGGLKVKELKIDGQRAYQVTHTLAAYKYSTYIIDTPKNSNYMVEGKRVNVFVLKGFNGDPAKDVYTKNFNTFVDGFRFK